MDKNQLPEPLQAIRLYAWIGEDEFDGSPGIKQGFRPTLGYIPLVSITCLKMQKKELVEQLQAQANQYGKTIYLAEYELRDVIEKIEPRKT